MLCIIGGTEYAVQEGGACGCALRVRHPPVLAGGGGELSVYRVEVFRLPGGLSGCPYVYDSMKHRVSCWHVDLSDIRMLHSHSSSAVPGRE